MRSARALGTGLLCICAGPLVADAQTVYGSIHGPDGLSRLSGSVVLLLDSANAQRARALSSERGEFALQAPAPGRYSLRVLRIGFRPTTVPPFLLSRDTTITLSLELVPVRLPTVTTLERSVCRLAANAGLATAMLWDEAMIAIIASAITLEQQAYRFDAELHSRLYDMRRPAALLDVAIAEQRSQGTRPWTSFSPDTLEQSGFAIEKDGTILFVAPDLDVLLSPFFAAKHCLQVHRGPPPAAGLIGLDFAPAEAVPHVELRGTLWLHESSRELSSLAFWFVNLPLDASDTLAGGRVDFRRLATGSWVLPRWSIRAPVPAKPVEGRPGPRVITPITGAHWRPLLANDPRWRAQRLRVVGGDLRSVRIADSTQSPPLLTGRTGSLALTVHTRSGSSDVPMGDAIVQLVGSSRRAISDAAGIASFPDLVEGDYLLDVGSAYYDALMLPPVRLAVPVRADSTSTRSVELLSLPGAVGKLCGTDPSKAILVGTVMRDGVPVARANVFAAFGADTSRRNFSEAAARAAKGTTRTDSEGRYRLCGAPRGVPIVVRASGAAGASAEKTIVVARDESLIARADFALPVSP